MAEDRQEEKLVGERAELAEGAGGGMFEGVGEDAGIQFDMLNQQTVVASGASGIELLCLAPELREKLAMGDLSGMHGEEKDGYLQKLACEVQGLLEQNKQLGTQVSETARRAIAAELCPEEFKEVSATGLINTMRRCMYSRITRGCEDAFDDCLVRQAAAPIKPRLSVIIPSWNRAETTMTSVESALQLSDAEIVVVINGSKDNTLEVVTEATGERVTVVGLKYNFGQAFARNMGVDYARGEYVYFLDSDDQAIEQGIEKAMSVMDLIPIGGTYGHRLQTAVQQGDEFWQSPPDLSSERLDRGVRVTPGMCVIRKKTLMENNGYFHEGLLYSEDIEWLWHVHVLWPWMLIDEPFLLKRQDMCPPKRASIRTYAAMQMRAVYGPKFRVGRFGKKRK